MKYVSFTVDNSNSHFCINLENVVCFVEKEKINIRKDLQNKKFLGLTYFRDGVFNVINTKEIFSIKSDVDYKVFILMQLKDSQIFIPVVKIEEIFESDDIVSVLTNSPKFRFVVKNKDVLNVLVEDYFFDY